MIAKVKPHFSGSINIQYTCTNLSLCRIENCFIAPIVAILWHLLAFQLCHQRTQACSLRIFHYHGMKSCAVIVSCEKQEDEVCSGIIRMMNEGGIIIRFLIISVGTFFIDINCHCCREIFALIPCKKRIEDNKESLNRSLPSRRENLAL